MVSGYQKLNYMAKTKMAEFSVLKNEGSIFIRVEPETSEYAYFKLVKV